MDIPVYKDIQDAYNRIHSIVHRTPVLSSKGINSIIGADIHFKCENFQKVGAFKFRGATNAILSLSKDEAKLGVATHSSGNHAAALALAAKMKGIPAYIVMPENSPRIKKMAVEGYGARITLCKPTLQDREDTLKKVVLETRAREIHPYDNFHVIAGQGTAAVELIEDSGSFDMILVPVGGGGLLGGTAIAVKHLLPNCQVLAGEPEGADDAYRSFTSGIWIPSENPRTIADGLCTSLGERNFSIIKEKVDDVVTVSEEKIIEAMRLIWERMKIIIEPSSAVPLAAIMQGKVDVTNKKVGIIISGGNLDLGNLPF